MSKVTQEKLLAGFIFGDNENEEYIYLPGGEVGSEHPLCVLERGEAREDVPLEEQHALYTVWPCVNAAILSGASAPTKISKGGNSHVY